MAVSVKQIHTRAHTLLKVIITGTERDAKVNWTAHLIVHRNSGVECKTRKKLNQSDRRKRELRERNAEKRDNKNSRSDKK